MGEGKPIHCEKHPGQISREETAVGRPFCASPRDLGNHLGGNCSSGEAEFPSEK